MVNLSFILSYSCAMEILRLSLEIDQKGLGMVNPFYFVLWCQHSWDPSCCNIMAEGFRFIYIAFGFS